MSIVTPIAAVLLCLGPVPSMPSPSGCREHTVTEEKVSHIFKLNAQRRRDEVLFDAVAGAALVIAGDGVLTDADRSGIVVAALVGSPDNNIVDMTALIMSIGDAIAAGERAVVARMIEAGRPRSGSCTWMTAGKMVEIIRRLRAFDEPTIGRVVQTIHLIGEHPLFLGFPPAKDG